MSLKALFRVLFGDGGPSSEELRNAIRRDARKVPRAVAVSRIEGHPTLAHPASAAQREQILALIRGPFDQRTHARAIELLYEALAARKYPLRPGTFEDVAMLEGLFDRLLDP